MDRRMLQLRFEGLLKEIDTARMASTRLGNLAAVEKGREAALVADLIGGPPVVNTQTAFSHSAFPASAIWTGPLAPRPLRSGRRVRRATDRGL